jgi:hypothetical protein
MGTINWTRVVLGGLVAGVIINVFEFLLKRRDSSSSQRHAGCDCRPGQADGWRGARFVYGLGFLFGIFAVWLYAAIRPRFGPGQATALRGAAAVWCLGYLLAAVTPFALNLFPARLLVIGPVVGLVEGSVGTLAGAWIYREQTR